VVWISRNVWCFPPKKASTHYYLDVDSPSDNASTLYDLIANVTLESVAGTTRDKESTAWKVHLVAGSGTDSERWFMIQDLVVEETRKEMIFLGETILQVCSIFLCSNFKDFIQRLSDLAT